MMLFSAMYGVISFTFAYYGEMMTYLGMSAPMAVFSLVSWLRNPYEGKRSEVKVSALGTANLLPSTLSVTTSFLAVCLTFRRSPYYAAAYAANDVVLVILWVTASLSDASYVSVAVCFAVFLANDIYGFISWSRMKKRQEHGAQPSAKKRDR